jgi:hypothetical protein
MPAAGMEFLLLAKIVKVDSTLTNSSNNVFPTVKLELILILTTNPASYARRAALIALKVSLTNPLAAMVVTLVLP